MKRHAVVTAVFAVAATCAALAAIASASGNSSTVAVISSTNQTSASAKCPSDDFLNWVGFETTTDVVRGVVIGSLRPGKRGGAGSAVNLANNDGQLTISVDCRERPATKRKRARKKVFGVAVVPPGGGEAAAIATCPKRLSVISGGFDLTEGTGTYRELLALGLERINRRQIRVTASNRSGDPHTAKAIALCGRGPKLTAHKDTVVDPASPANPSATASCPPDKQVALGGFVVDPENPGESAYIARFERSGKKKVVATAFDFDPNAEVTAIAYCKPA